MKNRDDRIVITQEEELSFNYNHNVNIVISLTTSLKNS